MTSFTDRIKDRYTSLKKHLRPFRKAPSSNSLTKETIEARLQEIVNLVGRLQGPYIGLEDLDQLKIDLCPLDTTLTHGRALSFFQPWEDSRVQQYPKDMEAPGVRDEIEVRNENLDSGRCFMQLYPNNTYDRAGYIAYYLVEEMRLPRKDPNNKSIGSLGQISGWTYVQGCPSIRKTEKLGWNEKFKWDFWHSWVLPKGKSTKPHIKATVLSGINAKDGSLLRVEALALLAVTQARMNEEDIKDHAIIPIMLFSCVGPRHSRILIAHFNGTKLVVEMSKLFRFTSQEEDTLLLFTRYLAADATNKDTTMIVADPPNRA